jgi:hypothetical protein
MAEIELSLRQSGGAMRALLNYINLLLHFADLLRNHVVCPISPLFYLPGGEFLNNPRSQAGTLERDMLSSLNNANLPDITEIVQAAPKDLQIQWQSYPNDSADRELLTLTNVEIACERISRAITRVSGAPGALSLYFPFRYDVELISRYPKALDNRGIEFSGRDNWLVDQLIDLDLPNLELLSPTDILAVRAGSEFSRWRKVLAEALIQANALPAHVWNRKQESRKEIDDTLREGKVQLEAAMSKSAVLAGLKKGSISMLAGLASVSITHLLSPTSPLKVMLLAGGANAIVNAIAESLKSSTVASGDRNPILAHYVAVLR